MTTDLTTSRFLLNLLARIYVCAYITGYLILALFLLDCFFLRGALVSKLIGG